MTNLYIVRHGETELNRNKVYQGWIDSKLTEEGKKQCGELRNKLKGIAFDVVITSPLRRAVDSAEIIIGSESKELILCDGFKELNFGQWDAMNYKDIEKAYPEEWKLWSEDWVNYTIPGGENFNMFYERVRISLFEILHKYRDKTVLLVAHEGTLKIITILLLKLNLEHYWNFKFHFGSYGWFEITDDFAVIRNLNC